MDEIWPRILSFSRLEIYGKRVRDRRSVERSGKLYHHPARTSFYTPYARANIASNGSTQAEYWAPGDVMPRSSCHTLLIPEWTRLGVAVAMVVWYSLDFWVSSSTLTCSRSSNTHSNSVAGAIIRLGVYILLPSSRPLKLSERSRRGFGRLPGVDGLTCRLLWKKIPGLATKLEVPQVVSMLSLGGFVGPWTESCLALHSACGKWYNSLENSWFFPPRFCVTGSCPRVSGEKGAGFVTSEVMLFARQQ